MPGPIARPGRAARTPPRSPRTGCPLASFSATLKRCAVTVTCAYEYVSTAAQRIPIPFGGCGLKNSDAIATPEPAWPRNSSISFAYVFVATGPVTTYQIP